MKSTKPLDIVVVPDAHADPDEATNDRFRALGKYLVKRKPDVIINIGDLADLASLSTYDKGKLSFEGKRYTKDLKAVHQANHLMFNPIQQLQKKQKAQKKKVYRPRTIMTLGNHENRINRLVDSQPMLADHVTMDDLEYDRYYQEIYPYMQPVEVNGVYFSHAFTSGIMGKPIGGVNHARSLVQKTHASSVCGHSHLRDYAEETHISGKKLQGLVVGCFVNEPPHWTNPQQYSLWSSGIIHLKNVFEGQYDHEVLSLEQLESM